MNDKRQSSVDILEDAKGRLYSRIWSRTDSKDIIQRSGTLTKVIELQDKLMVTEEEREAEFLTDEEKELKRRRESFIAYHQLKLEERRHIWDVIGGFGRGLLSLIGIGAPLFVGAYYHEKDMEWQETETHVLGPARTLRKNVENLLRMK